MDKINERRNKAVLPVKSDKLICEFMLFMERENCIRSEIIPENYGRNRLPCLIH